MTKPLWTVWIEDLKFAVTNNNRAAANAAVTKLLDKRAPLGRQWFEISELMRAIGELTLAHRAMHAFVRAEENSPQARYAKVVLNTHSGRMQEAHKLLASLPTDIPDRAVHAYARGNIALTLGKTGEALENLKAAVKYRPGWGSAWLALSTMVDLATNELGARLLADRGAAQRQPPGDYGQYLYAVGKLYADRKNPKEAFAAYAKGARLLGSLTTYNPNDNSTNARAARSGFSDGLIEKLSALKKRDTSRPIFVTGLPRSGTTLVEQILASHSAVQDGAELNLVQHVAIATGGVSGCRIQKYLDSGGTVDAMAGLYLHLLAERFGECGRVVDKSLNLSRCMGLVASYLPDAPLIWIKRNPLDNAWSCLRTFFIQGFEWSHSLTDIAHHFGLEDMLMEFWRSQLGDRLLVVPYEDLIEAPEDWTRRLLSHCNLTEEPAVFRPHETDRVIATASKLQVRQPINRRGLNVAEPYKEYLKPFIEAYSGKI